MPEKLLADIRATTALELLAVATGLVYIVLIVRRQRVGWIAGAISSCIYVWLAATARLPMQSALQAYYVLMAFYGWYSWTRESGSDGQYFCRHRIHHSCPPWVSATPLGLPVEPEV